MSSLKLVSPHRRWSHCVHKRKWCVCVCRLCSVERDCPLAISSYKGNLFQVMSVCVFLSHRHNPRTRNTHTKKHTRHTHDTHRHTDTQPKYTPSEKDPGKMALLSFILSFILLDADCLARTIDVCQATVVTVCVCVCVCGEGGRR